MISRVCTEKSQGLVIIHDRTEEWLPTGFEHSACPHEVRARLGHVPKQRGHPGGSQLVRAHEMATNPGGDKIERELAARRRTLHCTEFPHTRRGDDHRAIMDVHRWVHSRQDRQECAEDLLCLGHVPRPTIVEGCIGCDEETERTASRLWILDKPGGHSCQSRPIPIEV